MISRITSKIRQEGQGMTELAIAFPVLLLLFLGVAEVGAALRSHQIVTNAAREGARYGAKIEHTPDETVVDWAQQAADRLHVTDESSALDGEKATIIVSRLKTTFSQHGGCTYQLMRQYAEGGDRPSILTDEWLTSHAESCTAAGWPAGMPNSPMDLIAVEVMYDHPQLTGLFSIGRFVPDPVPMRSMTIMRVGGSRIFPCDAYPIALHTDTLTGKGSGDSLGDIYNGSGAGNFGWLRWPEETSAGNEGYLVDSLEDSSLSRSDFDNAADPSDHWLNTGDSVWGNTGLSNSADVRAALDNLVGKKIRVVVWDTATGHGTNAQYHIVGFAWIEITDYRLPGQDRITATFRGWDTKCTASE